MQDEPTAPDGATPTNKTQNVSIVGMVSAALPGIGVLYYLATKEHLTPEQSQGILSLAILLVSVAGVLGNLGSILAKRSAFRWLQRKDGV